MQHFKAASSIRCIACTLDKEGSRYSACGIGGCVGYPAFGGAGVPF